MTRNIPDDMKEFVLPDKQVAALVKTTDGSAKKSRAQADRHRRIA